jgi:hypothetical protein
MEEAQKAKAQEAQMRYQQLREQLELLSIQEEQ